MALDTRKQYLLVDPTTQTIIASFTGARRLQDLKGKRVGLIDDSKPNGKELLEELADLLKSRYGVANVMYHRKPSASKPADPKIVSQMGKECDYAIVAIGD
jgi:predicted GTPase